MSAQAQEDGNPLDRVIDLAIMFCGISILYARSFKWRSFLDRNLALTIYLVFALVSVLWSEYSFIAFKRWIRDSCNIVMVLVVLSEQYSIEAIKTVYRRVNYLFISLSVLLVKYFPAIGKSYTSWSGTAMWIGPTTGKNLLGLGAMLSVLFFLWDTLDRWPERKSRGETLAIPVNVSFLLMSLWVLQLASSATCLVCAALGGLVIIAAKVKIFRRHPILLKTLVPGSLVLYVILAYGLDMSGQLAGAVGKDPTLTDRTAIWKYLLGVHINPLLGTGYESFWLGDRLQNFWQESGEGHINEAHNGFLEVYINLGIIGVLSMAGAVVAGFRKICRRMDAGLSTASLDLAIWITALFFSITEAAFRSGLMWIMFLICIVERPKLLRQRVSNEIIVESNANLR